MVDNAATRVERAAAPEATGNERVFVVEGLDCADEIATLRRVVGPLAGGEERLAFDLLAGRMHVRAAESTVSDADIVAAVAAAGMRAAPASAAAPPSSWWRRHGRSAATAASGGAIAVGFTLHALATGEPLAALGWGAAPGSAPLPARLAYLLATIAGGSYVAPRAWAALRSRRPDMNLLMTLAVAGALGLDEWLEAATVAFLFAVALLLESWSVGRARHAVQALLDLEPPRSRVLDRNGHERDVASAAVAVGEVVVVRPGERVPLDGSVRAGAAEVDTSPITGESRPVAVGPGDEVLAGTIAVDGALEVEVTRPATDTVLARIVRRVAEAGRRRSRAERWVDRFARVYTPAVFAAALAIALLPPLAGLGAWRDFLYRGLVLLVIGCPCALVISTPVAVVAALAAAARRGVLVKGADVLELPARVGVVAFDKTGTLTRGEPAVAAVSGLAGASPEHVLAVALALERRSAHPVARAILAEGAARGVTTAAAEAIRNLPGRGVEGVAGGVPAWLGSLRLAEERGAATPALRELAAAAEANGESVVIVGSGDRAHGLIALADRPRREARAAIAELRRLGVRRCVMLTGDNRAAAGVVARAVGVEHVRAGLLPDEKVAAIAALGPAATDSGAAGGSLVAFVGDGVNDAPALAAADLGIAIGECASHAAIETADVTLVSADLGRIPWLVAHSRRTLAVIRSNVTFALTVKAAFVVLTALGSATLWAAIAADMGASLAVTLNSLRLLSEPRARSL